MKDSGSSHIVPLLDCTKVDRHSGFDIINNKTGRREAKEQTQLRDDKDAKTEDEEICIIKEIKQAKNSDIEDKVKDAFTYVNPYIKKDDGRTDIKALRSKYENVSIQEQYVIKTKCTIETIHYRNERAITFEKFVSKLVKTVDELEKWGRGMHNADIVEIIWQRVSNAELSQYLTDLKVQFQHQPRNYREVLQDIANRVPSIGIGTFLKAS